MNKRKVSWVQYQWRSEESATGPRAGVTGEYELPQWMVGNKLRASSGAECAHDWWVFFLVPHDHILNVCLPMLERQRFLFKLSITIYSQLKKEIGGKCHTVSLCKFPWLCAVNMVNSTRRCGGLFFSELLYRLW